MSETCIDPQALQEGDLAAYVDGTAGEAMVQHVRNCAACAHQAKELALVQSALQAKLYRHSCPQPNQLIPFLHTELVGNEKLVVTQHLRQCPYCARELASLASQERQGLSEQSQGAFATLKAMLITPTKLTAVRDSSAEWSPQLYRVGDVEIGLSSQRPLCQTQSGWTLVGVVQVGGLVPETIRGRE